MESKAVFLWHHLVVTTNTKKKRKKHGLQGDVEGFAR